MRTVTSRARAAPVLLQQSLRRLPRLQRTRHPEGSEPRPHPGRSDASRSSRASCSPGASRRATCGRRCCPRWPRRSSSTSNSPWGEIPASAQKALLHGAPGQVQVRARERSRPDRARGGVGRHPQERRAPLPRVVQRRDPGPARAVPDRAALPHLRRPPAQAGEPRGHWSPGKSIGDVVDMSVGRAADFFASIPLRAQGASGPGLDADIAGPILKEVCDRLRFLCDVGLDYLTLGRGAVVALGRRDAAHPAGHPDRFPAGRRALHPRRAEHRTAPARQ